MKSRFQIFILLTLTLASCACIAGCNVHRSADAGASFSLTIPLSAYVRSAVAANGAKGPSFNFPLLQIYDASGRLVYLSQNAGENANTLENLPGNLTHFDILPGSATLASIVDRMPVLQPQKSRLLHLKRATVVSVLLEECHACSTQEEGLDKARARLLEHGINLVILRVTRAPPGST